MTAANKISTGHLERLAIVYVRQSSIAQVRDNTESTARQYALVEEAARLGWDGSRISVIDADLGISGRTASARADSKSWSVEFALARWERSWGSRYRASRGARPTSSVCSSYAV
jgi:hypothetical protein